MPPHPRLAAAQVILVRALCAALARRPYRAPLVRWGKALHDRFLLPTWLWRDLEDVLAFLAERGLDGVEVYYPAHSPEQRAFYREQAERHGLLITGGSDSHHPSQPLAQWPAEWCAAFLERMGV